MRSGGPDAVLRELARSGGPLVETVDDQLPGHVTATFCWVDGESAAVYLDANGITDRARLDRSALAREPGSSLWHLSLEVPGDWAGQYRFLPRRSVLTAPAEPDWRWWRAVLADARPDPFGAEELPGEWPSSRAVMPCAPPDEWWSRRRARGRLTSGVRTVAGRERDVWVYETPGERRGPIVVVLDGRTWALDHPLMPGFDAVAERTGVAPVAVMIDSLDTETRRRDLGCNDEFVSAAAELVRDVAAESDVAPEGAIVAGCSLGGLTASYAALTRPDVFGGAVSMSGSYWWPDDGVGPSVQETIAPGSARFVVECGSLEWMLVQSNREVAGLLRTAGREVHHREFRGGHDPAQWRERLLAGVAMLLGPADGTLPLP
ncbi:enterochelin esterase [Rhodococcus rhodnii]|uniref:enterochelin esterase n=1 Tax=Rhodococcus rhodnii TaxID=38312 RepID=UPI001F5BC83A|nr:enterochelin esterase [Rhodococcus rhodnii]